MRHDAFHLRMALHALRQGGVIAHATEGVWGLACDPFDPAAVGRVLELKQRPVAKGLLLLALNLEQVSGLIGKLSSAEATQLQAPSASPVTWLLPATEAVPGWVRGDHASVAVRFTRHPQCRSLLHALGAPLVSTSANPAGALPAMDALRVRSYFGTAIDFLLPGQLGGASGPSQIRDLRSGQVLRA